MGINMKEKIDRVNELCRRDGVYKNLTTGQTTVSLWSKIKYFRQVFGDQLGFDVSVMEQEDYYIAKCKIIAYDPERVLATGHYKQFKKKNGTFIQGALSMAESFSISRALSFLGVLDKDITSLEELESLGIPTTKEAKDTSNTRGVPVKQIVEELKKAPHETRLNHLRYHVYRPTFVETEKNHPKDFRLLDNAFKSRMNLITKQEKI